MPGESCEWWSNGSQSHRQAVAAAGSAYPIADKCVAGGSEHR